MIGWLLLPVVLAAYVVFVGDVLAARAYKTLAYGTAVTVFLVLVLLGVVY